MIQEEGKRFNEGKLRYDLVNPFAHEQMVKVLTKGSQKYEDRNWEKGMKWSNVIASLKRHLSAIEKGIDFDEETGELHAAHLAANIHFLTAYYKIYPQGDDRPHNYLKAPKIGIDIDEVICDWIKAWCEKHNQSIPESWTFDRKIGDKFQLLKEDKDFWLNIPAKIKPNELPFEPYCYITSRCIPIEWTEEWLDKHGFPSTKVYSIPMNKSKVDVAKESGIDYFIDDGYHNFIELNKAGICTFLMDCKHNQRYNVGYKRIKDFNDFKERFL